MEKLSSYRYGDFKELSGLGKDSVFFRGMGLEV